MYNIRTFLFQIFVRLMHVLLHGSLQIFMLKMDMHVWQNTLSHPLISGCMKEKFCLGNEVPADSFRVEDANDVFGYLLWWKFPALLQCRPPLAAAPRAVGSDAPNEGKVTPFRANRK